MLFGRWKCWRVKDFLLSLYSVCDEALRRDLTAISGVNREQYLWIVIFIQELSLQTRIGDMVSVVNAVA